MTNQNNSINYIEFPLTDVDATKAFYEQVFSWEFTVWAPKYMSFSGAGIDGGFNGEGSAKPTALGVLVVLFSEDLEKTQKAVEDAGCTITSPAYDFPGGRRFHFTDPSGNELAVWAE